MTTPTSYQRAIDAGFEALEKCAGHPEMERAIRSAMLATWQSDMLFALRLGDMPTSPQADPRWFGIPAKS